MLQQQQGISIEEQSNQAAKAGWFKREDEGVL